MINTNVLMTSLNIELSYWVEEKMITSVPQNGVLYRRIILILGMHIRAHVHYYTCRLFQTYNYLV